MARFVKKPIVIEAVQITDEWFDGEHPNPLHPQGVTMDPAERAVFIDTLEGRMRGDIGDWLITGVEGEKYPCKNSVFVASYEPA